MSDKFDNKHFLSVEGYLNQIQNIYLALIKEISGLKSLDGIELLANKPFSFSDFPKIESQVENLFFSFSKSLVQTIARNSEKEWKYAEDKQKDFVERISKQMNLSKEKVEDYINPNKNALSSFRVRKNDGLNLSDRVWKYTDQYRNEIELGLDMAIGEGKSAAGISRDLRKYLKDPDMLFRRVRYKHGNLVLSKRAKEYNPGQGVYRSSYKNAVRLSRTENNIAYHEANFQKYQQFDFVIGIEIRLSNNPNHCPFCESMVGIYPKDFKFWGWHPQCRCTSLPVLKNLLDPKGPEGEMISNIVDPPEAFQEWVKNNNEKIDSAKVKPYFVQNNQKYTNYKFITESGELMTKARDSSGELTDILKNINSQYGGYSTAINLKSKDSIFRKVFTELNGDVSNVKDAVRATVILPKDSLEKLIPVLQNNRIFERIKIQTPEQFSGYSGILTNIKTKQGILAEVQFNTEHMIFAKEKPADAIRIIGQKRWDEIKKETGLEGGLGHKFYEDIRLLDPNDPKRLILEKESIEYYKHFR